MKHAEDKLTMVRDELAEAKVAVSQITDRVKLAKESREDILHMPLYRAGG